VLSHSFDCLVHHQIWICFQILSLHIKEFIKVKLVFQHQVELILLIYFLFTLRLEFRKCSIPTYSKQETSNVTLNLLGHLVALSFPKSLLPCRLNLFLIFHPTEPSSNPFLSKYDLFWFAFFQKTTSFYLFPKQIGIKLNRSFLMLVYSSVSLVYVPIPFIV